MNSSKVFKACVGDHHCSGNCSNTPNNRNIPKKNPKGLLCIFATLGLMGCLVPIQHAQLPGFKSFPTQHYLQGRRKPQLHLHQQMMMGDLLPGAMEVVTEAASCLAEQTGWTTYPTAGDVPGLCARLNDRIMNLARIVSLFQLYSLNAKSGTVERVPSRCSFQVWNFLDRQWNTSFNQFPLWMSQWTNMDQENWPRK